VVPDPRQTTPGVREERARGTSNAAERSGASNAGGWGGRGRCCAVRLRSPLGPAEASFIASSDFSATTAKLATTGPRGEALGRPLSRPPSPLIRQVPTGCFTPFSNPAESHAPPRLPACSRRCRLLAAARRSHGPRDSVPRYSRNRDASRLAARAQTRSRRLRERTRAQARRSGAPSARPVVGGGPRNQRGMQRLPTPQTRHRFPRRTPSREQ
jgi:hypothetical protein